MEAKLRQLMKHEGINSTRLAEILGIQASGISHIMSGRNKPSFDFLHKLLQRFPQINPDWLLLDKGPMYRDEIKNKGGQTSISTGGDNRSLASGNIGAAGSHGGDSGSMGGDNRSLASGNMGAAGSHGGGSGSSGGMGAAGGYGDGYSSGGKNDRGAIGGARGNAVDGAVSVDGRGVVSDVDIAYNRGETVAPNPVGVHNVGAGSHMSSGTGRNRPSELLFEPDNNDIIPSMASGGYDDTVSGVSSGGAGQYQAAGRAGETGTGTGTPHSADTSLRAPNILKRSASIERIVVFYKDKTFSEYQPE